MKILTLLIVLITVLPMGSFAEDASDQPSVLVTTQDVQQGSLPKLVTAYGTVETLPDGATTISLLRAGQVEKLAVSPGQKVKQGDVLLNFASDPATILAYGQAVTTLDAAKKEQSRTQQLLSQRLVTKSQLAQANKAANDAEAALEAEKKQGGDLPIEVLTAPFDGTITTITVSSGDRMQANAPLLQLAHGSGLAIGLGLPLDDKTGIEAGNVVHLEALDADKPIIDGAVAFVANILDPKSRLIKVLVAVSSDAAANLTPGEQFRANIETGKLTGTIVPRQAVLKDEQSSFVFQTDGKKAERVEVHVLGESGDMYVIDGFLGQKKKIVIKGNYELKDGAAVREADQKSEPDDKP